MSAAAPDTGTGSEAYRHRCEVAYVCDMVGRDRRAAYLDAIEKRRGREAGERLRADVKAEWRRRQQASRAPSPHQGEQAAQRGPSVHSGEQEACTNTVPRLGSFPEDSNEGPLRRDGCVDSGVSA